MRKNLHGKILKIEFKEQHLNTIPKSYPTVSNIFFLNINEGSYPCLSSTQLDTCNDASTD